MTVILLIIGITSIIIWGFYIGRNIRLAEYSSNRSHGNTKDIFFTLMGSLVGGYMFFGLTAIGYEAGTVAIAIGLGYCIGLTLLALSVKKIKELMDKYDCDTMDDFIGARFGKRVQSLVSLTNFLFFLAVVAAQFIAMNSYLSIVNPGMSKWFPLLAALVVILYTSFAGYKGVILTDFPQFIMLAIGALVLLITLLLNTNLTSLELISKTHLPPTGYGIIFLVGSLLLFPLTLYSRSDLWQRIAFSKKPEKARNAFLLAIPFLLLFYVIFTAIGIISRAELGTGFPSESSGIMFFTRILMNTEGFGILPDILLAVVSLGIFAALLSTADTNLNIGSVALNKLIYSKRWKEFNTSIKLGERFSGSVENNEQSLINKIKIISGLLGILALILSFVFPDIVDIMVACASILMVFLPSVIGALFFKHSKSYPAFFSILIGLLSFFVFSLILSNFKIAFIPSGIVAALVYIILYKVLKGVVVDEK